MPEDSDAPQGGLAPAFTPVVVEPRTSRRGWLAGVAGAALAGLATRTRAEPLGASADVDPNALLIKLVGRITFGYSEAEYARAQQLGYWGYIEEQLALTEADETPSLVTRLAGYTTLPMSGEQLYALNSSTQQYNELVDSTTLRAVFSRRQLYEKMVEFWSDHFNIYAGAGEPSVLKTIDDREVIRRYALSNFPQLLYASATSTAMLAYLNNDLNTRTGPNENYARELCELHTMGVGSGYTQADVVSAAKALTGWTRYNANTVPTNLRGTFRYIDTSHDKTAKVFLGHTLAANRGMEDGNDLLAILAYEPRTAAFIARKLCRRFLGETVRQGVIDAVAATYLATGGDIKSMLRTMLNPGALLDSPPRYKRPYHLFVSALRALPVTINSLSNFRSRLNSAQHPMFFWDAPDGYPDTFEYWSGLILPRWNFAAALSPGSANNIQVASTSLFAGLTTAQQIVDRLDSALFAGQWSPAEKNRVRTYLGTGNPTTTLRNEAIGLAVSSPGFQWY